MIAKNKSFLNAVSINDVHGKVGDRKSNAKRAGTVLCDAYQRDTRCISRDLTDI